MRKAVLDACVLVPASLRDTFLRLAEPPGLFVPLWSDAILAEVKGVLERQIGLTSRQTAHLERELRRHFPDSTVAGFEPLIPQMTNESKDRHVAAAAVFSGADVIVTFNRRHFPPVSTAPWRVETVSPGAFLEELYKCAPTVVVERLREQAENLGRHPGALLTLLEKMVPSFVRIVRRHIRD